MLRRQDITKFIRKYGGIIYPILKKINHIRIVNSIRRKEKIVSWGGEHPDKIFYVIWRKGDMEGIFSYANSFLGWIDYAVGQGYIPVIDMMNYPNTYLDKDLLGKENAYEYFFRQPFGYTMNDIKHAQNVIISSGEPSPFRVIDEDDEIIDYWHSAFQKYMVFSDSTQICIKQQYEKFFNSDDIVLGINVRGAGYLNLKSPGIPIQPDNMDIIRLAKQWVKKYNCTKIFLAVDTKGAYELFKREFGDMLVVNERKFYEHGGDEVTYKKGEHYKRGVEYITTVALLARCNYLIGGLSGAFITAQMIKPMGENYSDIYLFRMGKWTEEMIEKEQQAQINVAEYIVNFIADRGTKHIFGYPGGMLTYFMEECRKHSNRITAHVCYHEQAAAFCACGYAQTSGEIGVAYATSGPGATNLITGLCNAWFDSIPVVFITGQVNTFEAKGNLPIRQKGFQETDIIQMVRGVVKWCKYVESVDEVPSCLEKAWKIAGEGRKGPVLLDIPMNIWKGTVDSRKTVLHSAESPDNDTKVKEMVGSLLKVAKRPILLIGGGC